MKRRRIGLFVAGCALFMLCSAWLVFFYIWLGVKGQMIISHESGIYDRGTEISVTIFQKGTVYYTTDGRNPEDDWENVKEYTEPIVLEAATEGSAYSFKFFCQFDDDSFSEIQERNYLVLGEGRQITTDYVVMVRGNDYELFSDEEGVFVRGNQYYEYLEENPDVDILGTIIPANYYSDRELEVHSVIFTDQGQEIITQDSGLKIYGNFTREKNQKSFRLIARHDYDQTNEFSYAFFDQLVSDNTGSVISAFQRLSLHNAGNDNGYAFIRNTLCNELARQAGFQDVLVSRSATVFVNDRYMGVYWLQNHYDDRYFKEKYGSYQGEMVVSEGTLSRVEVSEEQEELEQESAKAYNEFCDWVVESDVNNPGVWRKVAATIDVENLLQYVAIEYYVNNTDWPENNVKIYRYAPAEGEEYLEGTVFDGRWRYLLFDLDYGMGLKFLGWFGRSAETEILYGLGNDSTSASRIFAKLMERQDCREQFVTEVLKLRNGSFALDNVNHVLEELNSSRWDELEYMMGSTNVLKDSLWEEDDNSIENVITEIQEIQDYASLRMEKVLEEIMSVWDCGNLFKITPEHPEGMEIYVNGQSVDSENARYFTKIPVTLSLNTDIGGIQVAGWYVNGEYIEGETVDILPQKYLMESQVLAIMPDWEKTESEEMIIAAFSTRGDQDWVLLENTGSVAVYLCDYFLSDDIDEPLKGRLPDRILQPGESILVYGEKHEDGIDSMNYQVNFSWNSEEPVVLAHFIDGILEIRYR